MSPPTAISSAEDTLLAALLRLARLKGTHLEEGARRQVEHARRGLVAVQQATNVLAERQCCGAPMTWFGDRWACTKRHH